MGREATPGSVATMQIGLILDTFETDGSAPGWEAVRAKVAAAENVGFDLVTIPDAITFEGAGFWESMVMAGAIAAATDSIGITHSVVNAPMRPPALVALAAQTIDEVSGGRYTLGIGAGNSPDDYEAYAIAADTRVGRFADTIAIIHGLLRDGAVDHDGAHATAHADRFGPPGPRPGAIPINIAGSGPRMLGFVARYADEWNWWAMGSGGSDHLPEVIERLDAALAETGRTVRRTLDIYTVDPLGLKGDAQSATEITETLLTLTVDEVRVDVAVADGRDVEAVEAMAPVVDALHDA
jgi:alkanesulfonate monooxygenase SsuD/methylene tetrahydromethanopterin reductase-like flavin-dependent oxidoreductase (luciferase family)